MVAKYKYKDLHKQLDILASAFYANGRTNSAAQLIWFLNEVFRLDDIQAEDAVCDGDFDKGFDGIFVNEDRSEILVFQSKRSDRHSKMLGDTDLKEFVGTIAQLTTKENTDRLASSTRNLDLKRILESEQISDKISQGYTIVPVFVTNRRLNADGLAYLASSPTGIWSNCQPIAVWDADRLNPIVHQLNETVWHVRERAKLKMSNAGHFVVGKRSDPSLVLAAVPAAELVKLPGISDYRIFAQNVRLSLGNTRVNLELNESVQKPSEHQHFLKFHNGLTVVAESIKVWGQFIYLNNFSVCNGCQSLLTFFNNKDALTDNLDILVRIVGVANESDLSQQIAYRTNNQNPINLRDLDSNDSIQIRLQQEFNQTYGSETYYRIKRGEHATAEPLENEEAGRLLLAIFTRMPWSSHQKYRVFGDLKSRVFSYSITAHHIRLAQTIDKLVRSHLNLLTFERLAKYAMTRYILGFMVSEILRTSEDGQKLLEDPEIYVKLDAGHRAAMEGQLDTIVRTTVIEMNYFVDNNDGDAYDYKRLFKSEKGVMAVANESTKNHRLDVARSKASPFSLP